MLETCSLYGRSGTALKKWQLYQTFTDTLDVQVGNQNWNSEQLSVDRHSLSACCYLYQCSIVMSNAKNTKYLRYGRWWFYSGVDEDPCLLLYDRRVCKRQVFGATCCVCLQGLSSPVLDQTQDLYGINDMYRKMNLKSYTKVTMWKLLRIKIV